MLWIIVVIIALVIIIKVVKPYFPREETVQAYTGGLGSGKSFFSVKKAIKLLFKNRRKVKWHNFWHRKDKQPMPLLYSSIPVRISRKEYAEVLTARHLLLWEKIVPRSVVFIDEIGAFASQFDFKNPLIEKNFDEFVRFYRHYTQNGYMVVNDQCSDNIVLTVRRRLNHVYNLMHFDKFLFIAWTKCRNMSISEEIKTIEEGNTEDNMRTLVGILPLFFRHYDTHCYKGRYLSVPVGKQEHWSKLQTNALLTLPQKCTAAPKTTNVD